ncbi:hypothetical protein C7212DRAFT_366578 [Tuber magnatum]|uniref:Uncharacterized protein n=1 Tax=Tuber magnatum TaxID=42249 RepID=A0A317SE39_9PEZI|nr:hypothetical protein C7212DRAFT_366578 [Tuber magnatum]
MLEAPQALSHLHFHLSTLPASSYLKPDSGKHNLLLSQGIVAIKWGASADQHLLLAILNAHKVTVDHAKVAGILGCTPRACEERLKKLRKLAEGWALEDCGEKVGERGGGGKNVNKRKRKQRAEKERAVEGGSNRGCELLEDILALRQEEKEGTTTIVTDVPAGKENTGCEAGLRDQDPHSEDKELTSALPPESPIKPDPSGPRPARPRSGGRCEWVLVVGF